MRHYIRPGVVGTYRIWRGKLYKIVVINLLPSRICMSLILACFFLHEINSWVWGNLHKRYFETDVWLEEAFMVMSMFSRWSALEQDSSLGSTAHAWQEIRRTSGGSGITHECSRWSSKPEWREQKSPTPSISMLLGPSARYIQGFSLGYEWGVLVCSLFSVWLHHYKEKMLLFWNSVLLKIFTLNWLPIPHCPLSHLTFFIAFWHHKYSLSFQIITIGLVLCVCISPVDDKFLTGWTDFHAS